MAMETGAWAGMDMGGAGWPAAMAMAKATAHPVVGALEAEWEVAAWKVA